MQERSLICIGGAPGSGSTRLGQSMERILTHEGISIEHLSIGDRIRNIGRGAVHSYYRSTIAEHLQTFQSWLPLDDEIMSGVVSEALSQADGHQIVLLDGYPRYDSQVETIQELALLDERRLRGMIVTETDWETSLTRMVKRGQKDKERQLTFEQAVDRLADHTSSFSSVLAELDVHGVPIRHVDTSGPKIHSDHLGLTALRTLLA